MRISDWSSDVCSSDLVLAVVVSADRIHAFGLDHRQDRDLAPPLDTQKFAHDQNSFAVAKGYCMAGATCKALHSILSIRPATLRHCAPIYGRGSRRTNRRRTLSPGRIAGQVSIPILAARSARRVMSG